MALVSCALSVHGLRVYPNSLPTLFLDTHICPFVVLTSYQFLEWTSSPSIFSTGQCFPTLVCLTPFLQACKIQLIILIIIPNVLHSWTLSAITFSLPFLRVQNLCTEIWTIPLPDIFLAIHALKLILYSCQIIFHYTSGSYSILC